MFMVGLAFAWLRGSCYGWHRKFGHPSTRDPPTFCMHLAIIDVISRPSWQSWAVLAVGFCGAVLALRVGRQAQPRQRALPASSADRGPEHDPFEYGSLTEKRRAPRRKGNATAVLISDADAVAEPTRGHVIDRSTGGLRIVLQNEIAIGMVLSLKVQNGPPATPWVQVEVRSCKKTRTGYEACCQFVRTPPWAVLLLFG